ncbi:MAG: hypothetical protein ACE5K7_07165, partial [Phycisphaerae bacterium]
MAASRASAGACAARGERLVMDRPGAEPAAGQASTRLEQAGGHFALPVVALRIIALAEQCSES